MIHAVAALDTTGSAVLTTVFIRSPSLDDTILPYPPAGRLTHGTRGGAPGRTTAAVPASGTRPGPLGPAVRSGRPGTPRRGCA
ncbi:hypothetical protein Ate01nite_71590 [Actinoplanes teichomyceticus]|nr:hypothetical protein Ate01nite_71590 [Actinoplanes teichomyceticus]